MKIQPSRFLAQSVAFQIDVVSSFLGSRPEALRDQPETGQNACRLWAGLAVDVERHLRSLDLLLQEIIHRPSIAASVCGVGPSRSR